jgi:hypothetical protein
MIPKVRFADRLRSGFDRCPIDFRQPQRAVEQRLQGSVVVDEDQGRAGGGAFVERQRLTARGTSVGWSALLGMIWDMHSFRMQL